MEQVEYKGLLIKTRNKHALGEIRFTENQIKNYIDLVIALSEVPPPIFNMESFTIVDEKHTMSNELRQVIVPDRDPLHHYYIRENPFLLKHLGDNNFSAMHSCKTSACAVGTAAYRSIGEIRDTDDWPDYTIREFGVAPNLNATARRLGMDTYHARAFRWLFDEDWASFDNTPFGAAMRILHFLHYSMPDSFHRAEAFCETGEYASLIYYMVQHKNLWPVGFRTDIDLEGFVERVSPEENELNRD